MASVTVMDDLFYKTLQDIYYAEKHLLKSLKKLSRKASSPELKRAFETHYEETEGQIERLDRVFDAIGKRAKGKTCDAILGITAEADEIVEEVEDPAVLDAGLVAAAQAAEHYEIARYGSLKAWAEEMGLSQVVRLLDQTLEEEKKTDRLLSQLAESSINRSAMMEGGQSERGSGRSGDGGRMEGARPRH